MKSKHLYNLYRDIIPKKYIFFKYIKVKNKKIYNEDEIKAIASYYEISKKEAKEAIEVLTDEHIKKIMTSYGK
jgi:hypothetical protein